MCSWEPYVSSSSCENHFAEMITHRGFRKLQPYNGTNSQNREPGEGTLPRVWARCCTGLLVPVAVHALAGASTVLGMLAEIVGWAGAPATVT